MIESKETKKRITNIITHWAKVTHASRELRQGDIPNLVSQILEEFYRVTLSCGHMVRNHTEGVPLTYQGQDRDGEPCEISGTYCADCAEAYKRNPRIGGLKVLVDGEWREASDALKETVAGIKAALNPAESIEEERG